MAPHRHTVRKECFVRRADRTEKMTMREIQDLTLQTDRGMAALEGVLDRRRSLFRRAFREFNKEVPQSFGIRATAIPTTPLYVEQVHNNEPVLPPLIHVYANLSGEGPYELFVPASGSMWRPILRGTRWENEDDELACAREIYKNGLLDYQLMFAKQRDPFRMYASWVMTLFINAMCAAEKFRCVAGAPDVEFALDFAVMVRGEPVRVADYGRNPYHSLGPIQHGETGFPIYSLGPREGFEELAASFERDFWNAAGFDSTNRLSVDFDRAFEHLGI